MSDPYQTTRLYEEPTLPPPPARRRHTWLYGLIGGTVALLAVMVVGAYVFILPLFQAQQTIPRLMGADTQLYISFTPNLSAVPGVQRLQAAYPDLFVDKNPENTDEQLEEALGVTFKEDVQPWLGNEIAVGISGIKDLALEPDLQVENPADELAKQAKIAIVLAARDLDRAQAFLDKQRAARGEKGQTFEQSTYKKVTIYEQKDADHSPIAAFAMLRGYVVFASDTASITAMIDRESSGKDTLEESARFKTVLANLPKTAVGYLYFDGPTIVGSFDSVLQRTLRTMPPSQADQLESQIKNLQAVQGMGLSISIVDEGLQFDTAAAFDITKFDQKMAAQIEAARAPMDTAQLQTISRNAVALITFKIPASFKDQIMEAIKAQDNAEETLKGFEDQFNLNLERDLLDWFVGDASLVLLPGENIGGTNLPATGYFVIRPQDKSKAEAGMKKIVAAIEQTFGGQELGFEQEQIAGVDWQVVKEPESKQALLGYGFADDSLVIAFGKTALTAAGGGRDTPITDDTSFKAVNTKLISPNSGIIYLNVTSIIDIVRSSEIGQGLKDDNSALKAIAPIKALGVSAEPGIDKDGLSRARLFVFITDN